MEVEQFFLFLTYHILNQKNVFDSMVGHNVIEQTVDVKNLSRTRGIPTDYDKYKRIQVDFDPLDVKYAWVVYLVGIGQEKSIRTKNVIRPAGAFITEAEALEVYKDVIAGNHKKYLSKNELYLNCHMVYLPIISNGEPE